MSAANGEIKLSSSLSYAVPGGGNLFNGYTYPGNFTVTTTYNAGGTGANQYQDFATLGGTTTISTPVSIDATTIVKASGATGFTHGREVIIMNDDPTNVLKFDPTVSNSHLFGLETAAKIDIQPGGVLRFSKPLGTNGWLFDSTHKIITLDPGAFAIPYRVMIIGD
jgi:hypothetical protein